MGQASARFTRVCHGRKPSVMCWGVALRGGITAVYYQGEGNKEDIRGSLHSPHTTLSGLSAEHSADPCLPLTCMGHCDWDRGVLFQYKPWCVRVTGPDSEAFQKQTRFRSLLGLISYILAYSAHASVPCKTLLTMTKTFL